MNSPFPFTIALTTPINIPQPGNPFASPLVAAQVAITEVTMEWDVAGAPSGCIAYLLLDANGVPLAGTAATVQLTGADAATQFAAIVSTAPLLALWKSRAGIVGTP